MTNMFDDLNDDEYIAGQAHYTVAVVEELRKIIHSTAKTLKPIVTIKPKLNYIAGTAVNDLVFLLKFPISSAAMTGITLGWNYSDGICALIEGIRLLLDEKSYRQKQNKIKGMLQIISGMQLLLFSANLGMKVFSSATPLAGASFAVTTFIDLLSASMDYCNAYKELNFEGWLEEKTQKLLYLDKRIIQLNAAIEAATLKKEKNELSQECDKLKKEFISEAELVMLRSKIHCPKTPTTVEEKNLQSNIIAQLTTLKAVQHPDFNNYFDTARLQEPITEKEKKREMQLVTDLEAKHQEARTSLIIKLVSFIGMSLLAIAPFVALPAVTVTGLLLTSAVGAYYLYTNSSAIHNSVSTLFKQLTPVISPLSIDRVDLPKFTFD